MISVQFLHCSFAGSYWIDCEVLDKKENFQPPLTESEETRIKVFKVIRDDYSDLTQEDNPNPVGTWYQIRYVDPNFEYDVVHACKNYEVRWVKPEKLMFPKFSEYNYG